MPRRRFSSLLRDRGGVAVIEFAVALPVLCTMVFGLYEVAQGVMCYYKMIDAASSIADLIGQTSTAQGGVGNTDFDNLYTAGQLIMSPNTGSNLKLDIAGINFDTKGKATQSWQIQRGGASSIAPATLQAAALPLVVNSGSVVIVQATYSYSSLLNYFITTPITMTYRTFAFPRNIPQIPCPPPQSSQTCK